MADWVAIIALILAVFAIITIIVVIFLVLRDNETIRSVADQWLLVTGGTTSPDTYNGSPDSIYVVNPGLTPVNNVRTVTIVPYGNIATGVTGTTTTIFMIDNTQNNFTVTLAGGNGATIQGSTTIAANTSAEFMWASPTIVRRLR